MELPAYMQPVTEEPKYLRLDAIFTNSELELRAFVYRDFSTYVADPTFRVVMRDMSVDQTVGVVWKDRESAMKLANQFVTA